MLRTNIQNWFNGRLSASALSDDPADARTTTPPPPVTPAALPAAASTPPTALPQAPKQAWPAARIQAVESVWGEGFLNPGGAEEILRLARPLGLSDAVSLVVVGVGTGGPAYTIADELGAWVSGFEVDPNLAALATLRGPKAKLGRRATIATWQPSAPHFRPNASTHGLALEPLRFAMEAPRRETMLAAIAAAIKPRGQLMLVEAVAKRPLDVKDPIVARWLRLEHRPIGPPDEATLTRLMGKLGFDVRVVEDISERHTQQTLLAWNEVVNNLRGKPVNRTEALALIGEVELWLLRLRLLRTGDIRLLRWHGIGKKAPG